MSISREELKSMILDLVEKDRELRHALMGLLGFKDILDRIVRLEERFARLEERQQKLEERFARLEEEFKKLYERQQILEERFAKLEERFAELEERFARLEERFAKLEERIVRLEERIVELGERQQRLEERFLKVEERLAGLEKVISDLQRTLMTVAHRFGVLSEEAFREALSDILERFFGAQAYRWVVYDEKGLVYGKPSQVEVDVVVHDNTHILIELKSRADTGDVLELTRIARLYEEREGVKPVLAIVAGYVSPQARKLAEKLGVKIYTYLGGYEQALP